MKKKILVLNWGSSTLKSSLYAFSELPETPIAPLWEKKIEWKKDERAKEAFYQELAKEKIDCIGHRIVHGGSHYHSSVRIDAEVKKTIKELTPLAPLHHPLSLEGIDSMETLFPNVPQVAVFDTAFHHTLPEYAYTYPIPHTWTKQGLRRYGFHGISFQYSTKRAKQLLGYLPDKMVICHLGAGASLCAVDKGRSVQTTMGFTPLEGLMMDTRCGSIDPGLILHLLLNNKMSVETLSTALYKESGLLGVSGVSDMRTLLEQQDAPRARLAVDLYVQRLCAEIAAMAAAMGGIEALVFTGGIGENASLVRERSCKQLEFLGIQLSSNIKNKEDGLLSEPSSQVKVLLIHAQEAFEIACESYRFFSFR